MIMKHLRRIFLAINYRKYLCEHFRFLQSKKKSLYKNIIIVKKYVSLLERRFKKEHSKFTKCYNFKLTNQLSSLSLKQKKLFYLEKRHNSIVIPNILNNSIFIFPEKLQNQSPDVEISLLENCYIYGQSIGISDKNIVYHPIMYNIDFECERKNLAFQTLKSLQNKIVQLYINKITPINNTICIHLLDEYAINYYHWLFEIMPKLIQINKIIQQSNELKEKKYTLVVNEKLPPQIIESIKLVVQFNYKVKHLANFESLLCTKLIYCTPFWCCLGNKVTKGKSKPLYFMDKKSTELVREKFYVKKESFRKVYFTRQSATRRKIINEKELKNFLTTNNFEVYDPSKLSFIEQINLLSETKVFISPEGATISNMIFMQPSTTVFSLCIKSPNSNPYVFKQIADVAQVNFYQILSENQSENVSTDFEINLDFLKKTFKQFKI